MRACIFIPCVCLVAAVMARPEAGYSYDGLSQQLQQQQLQLEQQPQQQPQQQQSQLAPLPLNAQAVVAQSQSPYQQLPQEQSYLNFALPTSQMVYLPGVPEQTIVESLVPSAPESIGESNFDDSYNRAHLLSGTQHASGYDNGPSDIKVHKHIYVHVPPKDFEEEEALQPRVHHQFAPKQKHYKIVFIKAPAAPAIRAPIVPPVPQHEEKTLIYVLHKKPEHSPDIVIPTPAPTKPSKPEVYFIKYKTKRTEAPVYGPPTAPTVAAAPLVLDMEPRNQQPAHAEDYSTLDVAAEPLAMTTVAPQLSEPQSTQLHAELPATGYGAPSVAAATAAPFVAPAEPATTLTAPLVEHMMSPIIVQDEAEQSPHAPASSYGPPTHYYNNNNNNNQRK